MHSNSGTARLGRSTAAALVIIAGSAVAIADAPSQPDKNLPANHAVWCTECNHGDGLPAYDIRVHDAVHSAVAGTTAQIAAEKSLASAAALNRSIAALAIDFDECLGTPKFIRSTTGFLTPQRPNAAWTDVVGEFVTANRSLAGFAPSELTANRVTRDFVTAHNGVRSVTVQQVHNGAEIFGSVLRCSVSPRGELINLSSTLLDRPADGFQTAPAKLDAARAVALAAADIGVHVDAASLTTADSPDGPEQRTVWKTPASLRDDEPLVTRPVYFPLTRDRLVPAWQVVVPQHGVGHTYDTVIDATDGKVLHRTDRLLCASPITFNVFTGDSPAPMSPGLSSVATTQAPQVSRSLFTVAPAQMGPGSPNGWITDGTTVTTGNNVDAYTDTDSNNSADTGSRPDGGASLTFDFPLDLTQAPSTYRNAAVTQMFYLCNTYHDRLYALGFTEAAGNYQTSNFGLGGTGNDAIRAEVQDGSGTSNANFSANGTDGTTGRCQMFLWTGPNPDRDGAFESDIVFHELSHGLSTRLHGSLSSTQSAGMGEGWGDFVGLCLNAQEGDNPDACYTTGPYVTYQLTISGTLTSNYYFGIRRYPYTTDMTKGPLTLGDIDSALYNVPGSVPRSPLWASGSDNDVHDYGEVWCQILWECRAAMVHAHGFAGNQAMLQLVVDGMKLSPPNPTFIQSRDAILNADQADNGGANYALLWGAFARRGMGAAASVPAATSTSGVVESFVPPIITNYTFPDGLPSQLSPTAATQFHVDIQGSGLTLSPGTGAINYRVNNGAFTQAPMQALGVTPVGTHQYLATIPPQPCLAHVDYYFSVATDVGAQTSPASAPTTYNAAIVYTTQATLASDDFETATGWSTGPNTATSGLWTRGNPNGTSAQPEDDHTPGAGVNCFFTGQGTAGAADGTADIDGGQVILTSPAYDLSSVADASVSYWRWYSNGAGAAAFTDVFRVLVSTDNGTNWTPAETVGPASSPDTNPGWRFATWSLSSLGLAPTSQVKVRFIAEDAGSGSLVEAALDDFAITALQCESGPAACSAADVGKQGGLIGPDGQLDNNDFVAFIDAFFSSNPVADVGVQGGLPGHDGMFDNNDFVVFIDVYFAGCP